ncbi:mpv17-like protein [Anguilla anguilla]|uniref:Mpv17-like protein n=1 Tax=Anguilla anguilla TaxID=7936 RepID=A0A0E9XE11_ANGAN|nr:mpv17-like protein [Anguilla anguilla]XP_035239150.1 mpv17-like protein [Anguilla anguilla]XP_035239160.1 mpv17-like protein [Anguilla anguilla]XP_035239167.1 mpv17-like protein [Anguilla anguilla]KAG5856367.1 hypothetical protein ANANG_G00007240 [Anguilla anguilla]
MNRLWSSVKSHPYLTNVVGFTALFASADLIQQSMLGGKQGQTSFDKKLTSDQETTGERGPEEEASNEEQRVLQGTELPDKMKTGTWSDIDWSQTAQVGLLGFCFHANFNYIWLRGLERMCPGGGVKRVAVKILLDQLIAGPVTISAFYIGLSVLDRRRDPFEDWREKFWTSYKVGVIFWSTMQAVNFSLVPPVARTVFVGGINLIWTIFLCHLRQQRSITHTNASTK